MRGVGYVHKAQGEINTKQNAANHAADMAQQKITERESILGKVDQRVAEEIREAQRVAQAQSYKRTKEEGRMVSVVMDCHKLADPAWGLAIWSSFTEKCIIAHGINVRAALDVYHARIKRHCQNKITWRTKWKTWRGG